MAKLQPPKSSINGYPPPTNVFPSESSQNLRESCHSLWRLLELPSFHGLSCFCIMGFPLKITTSIFIVTVLSFSFISATSHFQSGEEGFISVVISDKGLDYAKELLIRKAVSANVPLRLSDIEKSVKIPLVGKVHVVLSNILIDNIDVTSSNVETGEAGVDLVVSGATANMTMKWEYSYSAWFIEISDNGDASVQVEGLEIALIVALKEKDGILKLSLLECRCNVEDILIDLEGGASWLYEGVVDAFQGKIGSAVEDAISKKIGEGIKKLDALLQSLPKVIPIDNAAALNVTFVTSPVLHNSSVEFNINGLFTRSRGELVSSHYHEEPHYSVYCNDLANMIEISIDENVFNSASEAFIGSDHMHWIVDKFPDQSLLNTSGWKEIFPQMYDDYPDDGIDFNVSVPSPPFVRVMDHEINATISMEVIINVLDVVDVIPVACISLEIMVSVAPKILVNNLAAHVDLQSFMMFLRWSKLGNLQLNLIQPVLSKLIENTFLPYINLRLGKGFPLPLLRGFALDNATLVCANSRVVICSNVYFRDQRYLIYF